MHFRKNYIYAQSVYITPRQHFKTCQYPHKIDTYSMQNTSPAPQACVQLVNKFTHSRAFAYVRNSLHEPYAAGIHFVSSGSRAFALSLAIYSAVPKLESKALSLAGIRPINPPRELKFLMQAWKF